MAETTDSAAVPNRSNTLRLIVIFLLISLAIFQIFKEPPYKNISNDELQTLLEKNIPVYDIRRPEEWHETGVIKGSKLLTYIDANGQVQDSFMHRFTAEVGNSDPVILICRTGSRTRSLAYRLIKEQGYTNVFNVEDGIKRWIRDKRPVQENTPQLINRT